MLFKFVDLFAGIGGIRIAFENAGGRCVFSSEIDKFCCETYENNFGEKPGGDIRKIHAGEIPSFDILCAGFPCQSFSIAGVSKLNSLDRAHGFKDETRGTLFYEIARILEYHIPPAFFLENVKHLVRHDRGKTFEVILRTLKDELGYKVFWKVIDAAGVVPQHRERVYIVGFKNKDIEFEFPEMPETDTRLRGILDENVDEKYTLSDRLWKYLQDYARKHRAKGNGFGYGLADPDGITRTLSARYYKDGSEILVPQENANPRKLTPRECARLMGFPESFKLVVSDTQAYRQFGNSVVVPVVETIAKKMVKSMSSLYEKVL